MVRTPYIPNKALYRNYYLEQSGGSLPVFEGEWVQRGYGLGGIITGLIRRIIPILSKGLRSGLGKQLVSGSIDLIDDIVLKKVNPKTALKKRGKEQLEKSTKKLIEMATTRNQTGKGYRKRKRTCNKQTHIIKHRKKDIFG